MSLQKNTIKGVFWSLLQKAGSRGISFLVIIFLARLLTPEEFGLIGMISIFIQVSQAMVNGSFNQALVQKKDADDLDFSSVFVINLIVSLSLYIILFFSAPFIAAFYDQSSLTLIIRVLTLIFVINAFSYTQEAKFTKNMEFRKLMIISIPSIIASGIISIIMAVLGYGVWSIVALQILNRFFFTIQIWYVSKWKPKLLLNFNKAKTLFRFGGNLMLATVIRRIYDNIYLVVIGRFFPLAQVGYYQHSFNLMNYPTTTLTNAINIVTFSALSTIQDDTEKLKRSYQKIVTRVFSFICPLFVFAALAAKPLFLLIFTEKWLPAVPYFQILCVVGIFYPLNAFNLSVISVKGRTDVYLKLEIIKKIIITAGIVISLNYGIIYLLCFQAFNSILEFFINGYYVKFFIQYKIFQQVKDVGRILLISLLPATVLFFFNHLTDSFQNNVIFISVNFVAYFLFYIIFAHFVNINLFKELLSLVKRKI